MAALRQKAQTLPEALPILQGVVLSVDCCHYFENEFKILNNFLEIFTLFISKSNVIFLVLCYYCQKLPGTRGPNAGQSY